MADGLVNYGIIRPEFANAMAAGYNAAEERRNTLAQQQQARQLADIQLQNALREQRLAGEEESAWKAGAGDTQKILQELQTRGLGKQAMALQGQMQKQQADRITMLKGASDLMKDSANAVFANPTLDNAVTRLVNFGKSTGADISSDLAILQKIGDNPEGIKQWAAGHAITADKMLPKFQHIEQGGAVVMGRVNPLTGEFEQTSAMKKTPTPGDLLRDARARERLTAEQESGDYSPQTIDYLANIYNQTGQLPALGIGKKAGSVKMQILDRATQLGTQVPATAPGETPTPAPTPAEAATKVVQAKQTRAAEQASLRDFASGMSGRSVTAFNTAIDHLDTLAKLATALNNGDTKAFNAVANMFARQTGNPAPTNFDVARSIVGGEVAKALTGSNMALKDREEIRDAISSSNSPAQLEGVARTKQQFMGGQLKSLKQKYQGNTGRKDFEDKFLTPRSKEVLSSLAEQKDSAPSIGTVQDGWRFKGGDPADKKNWEKQ